MWTLIALSSSASAGVTEDVANGWYLWSTGQDDAAHAVAAPLADAHPDLYDVHRLAVAMEVVQGNGASVEAHYREWWNEDRDDPVRRVSLAFVLAQRHGDKGGWCQEVEALLHPLNEGEPRYWAAVASRQKDLRCAGDAGHSDAELQRIAREVAAESKGAEAGGLGWADGVVARMRSTYIKEDLPADLERLFELEPHRVAEAGVLWADNASGPALAGARRAASKAMSAAVDGDDPSLVHAALLGYRAAGKDKQVEEAAARLASLDGDADVELVRSVDDVRDPEVYAAIDSCMRGFDRDSALGCLDGLPEVPESGAITAHWQGQRRALLEVARRPDEAFAAARAAWQADPTIRFNARLFAKSAVARAEDVQLAADALAVVVADRTPGDDDGLKRSLAADLDLYTRARLALDLGAVAVDDQRQAYSLDPRPEYRTVLGLALAAADRPDDAALQLAHGLAVAFEDTALVTRGRKALDDVAADWMPGGMQAMIAEATRALGEEARRDHPLVGSALPNLAWLPEAEDAEEPGDDEVAPDPTFVFGLWAPWSDDSTQSLARLASIHERYADRGVEVRAIDVGIEATELPEDLTIGEVTGGAAAMRSLGLVALPSVVVTDYEGQVVDVIVGWDRASLQLEDALDDWLPEDEE